MRPTYHVGWLERNLAHLLAWKDTMCFTNVLQENMQCIRSLSLYIQFDMF